MRFPNVNKSNVTMVKVDDENTGAAWWIVAATWKEYDLAVIRTWLTDVSSQSDASQWIYLDKPVGSWNLVDWPRDRLILGMSAQAKAVSCLPDSDAK